MSRGLARLGKGALLALAGALCLTGCDKPVVADPAPALWEVRGPSGEAGWLFGTIHALPDGTRWRTPVLERVLEQADLLVVEVADLDDQGAAAYAFAQVSSSPGLPPLLM